MATTNPNNPPVGAMVTITGSPYNCSTSNGDAAPVQLPHDSTDWEVRKVDDGTLVWSSLENTTNLLSIDVPEPLPYNTEYKFRIRYRGLLQNGCAYTSEFGEALASFIGSEVSEVFKYLAVAHNNSPFITTYSQDDDTFTKLDNPTVLPAGSTYSVAFSADGVYKAVTHSGTPFVTIYKRSGNTFTKLPNPDVLPTGIAYDVSFSADGTYMAVAHLHGPFVTIYKRSGDVFTKLPNPDVLPGGVAYSVAFSPDSTYMAVGHSSTPYITIYKRTGDTFTKLPNPSTLPFATGNSVTFSPDGVYMAVAHFFSPYITIYKRTGDTFTKLTNPATLPGDTAYGVSFSPDGTYIAVAHEGYPFITIYKRSGDTFTKLGNPATLPAGECTSVAFSADGEYLAFGGVYSPYLTIYKRSGDTFTKLANPAILPTGNATGLAFFPQFESYLDPNPEPNPDPDPNPNPDPSAFDDKSSLDGLTFAAMDTAGNYDSVTDTGYFGEVSAAALITGDALASSIGLTAGVAFNSTAGWLKFYVGPNAGCNRRGTPYVLYIAKKPYRRSITWDAIYQAGSVYGTDGNGLYPTGTPTAQNASVTIGGTVLKVRLLTGAEADPSTRTTASTANDNKGLGSEWNSLMYRVNENVPVGGTTTSHGGEQVGDNWATFTNADLNLGSGDGRASWCQETVSYDTAKRVHRGNISLQYFTDYSSSGVTTVLGYRPCLETAPETEPETAPEPDADISKFLAVANISSPAITIYSQDNDTFNKLSNPTTLPNGRGEGIAVSPDGVYMAAVHTLSPYITIYKRTGGVFTKLPNPAVLPTGESRGVVFSADGTYMAVAHDTSPFITIYKRSGDTFTKLPNPATLPTGNGYGVAFSPDGTYMTIAHAIFPRITIYKRTGDTFTKLANPDVLPGGVAYDVSFSPNGTYMVIGNFYIYKRSGDTFTKLTDPSTLPTGDGHGVAVSADSTYVAVAHINWPFVTIYKRSGDTFTKLANPSALPTGNGWGVAFSADGVYMAVGHTNSPFITIYKRSGDTFTKLDNPSTLPASSGKGVAFFPRPDALLEPEPYPNPSAFDDGSILDGLTFAAMVMAGKYDLATDTGYFGEVSSSVLFTGSQICTAIGLTAGTLQHDTEGWLKFYVGENAVCNRNGGVPYVLYIAKKPYRHSVSWDDVYQAGAVYGTYDNGLFPTGTPTNQMQLVFKDDLDFKVRLMTGADADPSTFLISSTADDNKGLGSEWNSLMYRVHEDIPVAGTYTYHGGVQVGYNWASFTIDDLGVGAGEGRRSWCQERVNYDTTRRVTRGISLWTFVMHPSETLDSFVGYRPCLELI